MTRGEETLPEVTADDLPGIANGSEICAGIPLQEEIEIDRELGEEHRRGIRKVGNKKVSDFRFGESRHWS